MFATWNVVYLYIFNGSQSPFKDEYFVKFHVSSPDRDHFNLHDGYFFMFFYLLTLMNSVKLSFAFYLEQTHTHGEQKFARDNASSLLHVQIHRRAINRCSHIT